MGVLGGRKETKEVSDILETEVADGDCLDRLMRARGELAILRSCTWEWWAWADVGKEGWGGLGARWCTEQRPPTMTRFNYPLQTATLRSATWPLAFLA